MLKDLGILILVLLVLTFLTELISRLFKDLRSYKSWRIVFFLSHPVLLTVTTLFVANSVSFFNGETQFSVKVNTAAEGDIKNRATAFLDSNFVLIDNATDKTCIPLSLGGNSTTIITQRRDIAQLLKKIEDNLHLIDLVVLDIDFSYNDPMVDNSLLKSFQHLSSKNKFLIATGETRSKLISALPDSVVGRVWDEINNGQYTYHQITADGQISLPYLLYQRLDHTQIILHTPGIFFEKRKGVINPARLNTFLPDMPYEGEFSPISNNSNFTSTTFQRTWKLESFRDSRHLDDLISDLDQRKNEHRKNILFIGDFSGIEDKGQTPTAVIPGPAIIFNIFYSLHLNEHNLSIIAIVGWYLAYLTMTLLLVWDAMVASNRKNPQNVLPKFMRELAVNIQSIEGLSKKRSYWKKMLGHIIGLLIEHTYLIFLIAMLILIRLATGMFVNATWVLFYLLFFKKALGYFLIKPENLQNRH